MSDFEQPKRYFLFGATGTGKTLFARQLAKKLGQEPYLKTTSGYWENYLNQKVVLIDDITPKSMKYLIGLLPKWADCTPFYTSEKRNDYGKVLVPAKQINPCNYILVATSCYDPDDLFAEMDQYTRMKLERLMEFKHLDMAGLEEIKQMA